MKKFRSQKPLAAVSAAWGANRPKIARATDNRVIGFKNPVKLYFPERAASDYVIGALQAVVKKPTWWCEFGKLLRQPKAATEAKVRDPDGKVTKEVAWCIIRLLSRGRYRCFQIMAHNHWAALQRHLNSMKAVTWAVPPEFAAQIKQGTLPKPMKDVSRESKQNWHSNVKKEVKVLKDSMPNDQQKLESRRLLRSGKKSPRQYQ